MEYLIGEFSCITRLTVKTLRYYHEEGLLLPARIDAFSGYRYYNQDSIEQARVITILRSFDFSIAEIKHVLCECSEDEDLCTILAKKARMLDESLKSLQLKQRRITQILSYIEEQKIMNANQNIIIKDCPAELVATIRYRGKYQEIGRYFGRLFKVAGGKITGKPFALYHDAEYREDDADIEAGFAVRTVVAGDGIGYRTLEAYRCLSVVHKGAYDSLSASYAKLTTRMKELGLVSASPIREIYLKGPGMIFRGNPRNYLTEIQMPIENTSIPGK